METHEKDPTSEDATDPWETFHERWSSLGNRIKETYRRVADEDGPTEEEIRQALGTLAGAWNLVADSIGTALQDPEVRQRLKDTASSLATAVGSTISELGSELNHAGPWRPSSPIEDEEE